MRMFIGYFLMGYLLASLKIEKMTDILRMRRFQTLMTSVRFEIRQNLCAKPFAHALERKS